MFKLTIIGSLCLASMVYAQEDLENSRFLQGRNRTGIPKQYKDTDTIKFAEFLGCGACIRGGYIFCIPGPEGSDPSTWPAANRNRCYQSATTLAAAKLPAPWTCSNTYTDKTLAKAFCPFQANKCGAIQDFDFGDVGEKTTVKISLAPGETCNYRVRSFKGFPRFKPSDTTGFEIENVDYDDDDLQDGKRMLQGEQNAGPRRGLNRTKEERQKGGFKAESEAAKPNRNIVPRRDGANGTQPGKGPRAGKYDPSNPDSQNFKGAKRDKSEPLEKVRYQQISVTALGNLTSNTSSRILQEDLYDMDLEIGSEDFSGAYTLVFSASVLIFSLFAFF